MTDSAVRRATLGAYLAFAFSLLSVLLTVLLIAVIERHASRTIINGIGANLAELASQTTSRLDRGMFERYREIELLAQRLGAVKDPRALQAELTRVQASYRYYAWVGVTDAAGVVRAASRGMLEGVQVGQRPWFRQGQSGGYLGDVHEAVLLAQLLAAPGSEPLRFFDVAFPLRDAAGALTGVLGAHVSWEWAKDVRAVIFRPVGQRRDVEALVLSSEGVVLLGPPGLQDQKLDLSAVRQARAGEAGQATEVWADGKSYLVGFSRMRGHESSPGLGWIVLVRQELTEAFAPVRELQRDVLGSGVAIAVLFSLLGWLVARGITAPLLALANTAKSLESGAPVQIKPSAAYREVAMLGTALTSLVANLHRNQEALRELNARLEQRVAERTAELLAAFERVQASDQRTRTILESAQDPFIGVDMQGRIVEWNSQAEVVFGWQRHEILGCSAGELLLPARHAGALEAALREFVATGAQSVVRRPIERLLVDRHGREIAVEVKVGFVDSAEQPFFSAFVHDVTARKEVERLKDEFVSTVSHELRTPLTSIYGSLNLLDSGVAGELPADAHELVRVSLESTERLVRLINDMLDVEKITSGKIDYRLQRQPLRPLVERAMRDTKTYAAQLHVSLRLRPGEDVLVDADADRIVQVCVNLLSNAAKFSPQGGKVEVSLHSVDGMARVCVVDRGPGIPPEFHGRVFERFAQADASDRRTRGGTGLGLNICRSIIEAHRGGIGFTSEPGVRTEFFFTLPAAASAPATG